MIQGNQTLPCTYLMSLAGDFHLFDALLFVFILHSFLDSEQRIIASKVIKR